MIEFETFPKSGQALQVVLSIVDVFRLHHQTIDSHASDGMKSDDVLSVVRNDLEAIGFEVEKNKTAAGKLKVPVLFGRNGRVDKSFDADAIHLGEKVVLEVEAGRAVSNYQFLKDLFQACMMQDVEHLVIAVRNNYLGHKDFETVAQFFSTLYASQRLQLPLKSVTVIGY